MNIRDCNIYELILDKSNLRGSSDFDIVGVGVVTQIDQQETTQNGLTYKRTKNVGYYIASGEDNSDLDTVKVRIKTLKDFGDEINCELTAKPNSEVYYVSQYLSDLIVDSICIVDEPNEYTYTATKINR